MHTTLGVHSSQPQDEGLLTSADAYVTLVKMVSLQTALHRALLKSLFVYYLSSLRSVWVHVFTEYSVP